MKIIRKIFKVLGLLLLSAVLLIAAADAAEHTMTWVETKKATKKEPGEEEGVCSVCDYKAARTVEYEKPADSGKWILYAGIGAAAVVVLLMIASAARQNRARRRRQAARRRRYYEDEDR